MTRLLEALEQIAFVRRYTRERSETVPLSQWHSIPLGCVSNIAWQVGHLALAEYRLCLERLRTRTDEDRAMISDSFLKAFGRESEPASIVAFAPETIRSVFDTVHARVMSEIANYSDTELDSPPLIPHPLFNTRIAGLRYAPLHEMIHCGQIALSSGACSVRDQSGRIGLVDIGFIVHQGPLMLDAAFIRENADKVRENCVNRGVSPVPVDRVVAFEARRVELDRRRGETGARKNAITAQYPRATTEEKASLKQQADSVDRELANIDTELTLLADDLRANLIQIPNMTHPAAPIGTDAAANVVVSKSGEKPRFDFKPKDHVALCESLDLADFEAGSRVAGQKFYFLKNEGALLEIALVQYAMQTARNRGYIPIITPDLARVDVLEGIGFQPRDPNPETRQVYKVADSDLCLIATAEITLGGMHRDHIFDESELPRRYVGLSHCFRTEAGAAGRDTRGLYRVHQFTKVEMFAFCTPEQSEELHQEIRQIEEEIFRGLGLCFHVIDTCTGDLGGPAYRKYDLEAWMPGRGDKGDYGEVTSTSNCTDYQARRLGVRYKSKNFKKTRFVHTLNGTAIACTRALVAILEHFQQADGSVGIPEVLQPWVGKTIISRNEVAE